MWSGGGWGAGAPYLSFVHGVGVKDIVNYTLNMVGGSHGGPLEPNSSQWNSSFHGDQEIVADKYQLCARALEPAPVVGTYKWVNFTSCLNGYQGIAICTVRRADCPPTQPHRRAVLRLLSVLGAWWRPLRDLHRAGVLRLPLPACSTICRTRFRTPPRFVPRPQVTSQRS